MKKTEDLHTVKSLIEEEYYLDAIKILKKLHKDNPNSPSIKYELARAWISADIQQERGIKYLEKLEDNKGRIGVLSKILLGRVNLCKKQYKEAHIRLDKIANEKLDRQYILSELMYLAIREEQYEKAFDYYNTIIEEGDYWGTQVICQIEMYLKYKLGKNIDLEKIKDYYFGQQVLDYSEDRTIEHISFHKDEIGNKDNHSIYLENTDINEIYNNSKERITSINPSFVGIIDKYILEWDKPIGIVHGEEVDSVNVITLPNTYDILTIHPSYNYKTRVKK